MFYKQNNNDLNEIKELLKEIVYLLKNIDVSGKKAPYTMSPHNKNISVCFIEEIKKALGYYQTEFCSILGIPYGTYCKIAIEDATKISDINREKIKSFMDNMKKNKNIDFDKMLENNVSYKKFLEGEKNV